MVEQPLPRLVYRGAKEICGAVGVPWKEISSYVHHHKLPAFKLNGGTWVAIPDDLLAWVCEQRDKHIGGVSRGPVKSR